MDPESVKFRDDGKIPNNRLPLLLYRRAFPFNAENSAGMIESRFEENGWTGSWRGGVFPYHHYHSTTHEVLGVCGGRATLQLGGEGGTTFEVRKGDVIVIPAGVGHMRVESSPDFEVVGAYPDGLKWDLLRGEPGERPGADQNIASVPLPRKDPIYGAEGPLNAKWTS